MKSTCDDQGIEIIQALITTIKPPEKIADPVRRRQIALQQEAQYKKMFRSEWLVAFGAPEKQIDLPHCSNIYHQFVSRNRRQVLRISNQMKNVPAPA
jgi:hypothetical protein